MISKKVEKLKALALRRQGETYNEILEKVPVAKSTLSLWLRETKLSKAQVQKLTAKKRAAQQRGGDRRREMRTNEISEINMQCKKDIISLSKRELFLIGVVLYWAEGAKRSGNRPGVLIDFANSDPEMVSLFTKWLQEILQVPVSDITLRLHLHLDHKHREKGIKRVWSSKLKIPIDNFSRTMYKKHNPKTVRKKTGDSYIGLVSVRVKKSTSLNRRILGWIYAIIATQK